MIFGFISVVGNLGWVFGWNLMFMFYWCSFLFGFIFMGFLLFLSFSYLIFLLKVIGMLFMVMWEVLVLGGEGGGKILVLMWMCLLVFLWIVFLVMVIWLKEK